MVGRSTLRNRHHANRPCASVAPSTTGNLTRIDDRKRNEEYGMQIHPIWPEMPQGQGELFFECTLFLYSVLALFLQYLNLYKTMWWLPKSYWHYSVKFHLINPYLLSCVGLLLGIRVTKCFWKTMTELAANARQDASKAQCLFWDIIEWAAVKTPMFTMVATSFLFSFSRVYFDFPFKSLLYFGHPILFFLYLFHDNVLYKIRCYSTKLWFILNGRSSSEISKVTAIYRDIMRPPILIDVDSVVHICSTNPLQIREEVSVLVRDFGLRIKHCFFSGLTTAYLSIFVPCVFTPQRSPSGLPQQMYIDILWIMELFCVVFLTSFSLYATYLLPLQYCDLIHRCATHLGKWERLDRLTTTTLSSSSGTSNSISSSYYGSSSMNTSTCSSTSSGSINSSGAVGGGSMQSTNSIIISAACTEWSEHDGLYADGSIVRHQGQLYRAVAISDTLGVAAEPGDSDHSRFYRIGSDPITLISAMAIFQVILIAIQFWLLILTTDWQHIVTLVLLIFANYLLLAKTFKDRIIIGRIYKPSPEDLQLIRQLQQYE
ncbi:Transmembrane protein 39A [Dirofilaria immitis]